MFQLSWSNSNLFENQPKLNYANKQINFEVSSAAFLLWEEHCIECAPPDCYKTCLLYVQRSDKKCARFVYGISKNTKFKGAEGFGADITFRRWAKLETQWTNNPRLYPLYILRNISLILNSIERIFSFISSYLEFINPKRRLNGGLVWLYSKLFKYLSTSFQKQNNYDGFFLEFFFPENKDSAFQFEIIHEKKVSFRERFPLKYGWNRYFISAESLPKLNLCASNARIWNEGDEDMRVIITWLHLVKFKDINRSLDQIYGDKLISNTQSFNKPKIKCLVFDLDNTLWDGVIGDDGPDGIKVRDNLIEFIYELDKRGIISAIASKNDFQIAWNKIKEMGLSEYFLFPQIHWGAKSNSIKKIAEAMNVGLDTLGFIDDSPFERKEVSTSFPQVRTYDVKDVDTLLFLDEFNPAITEESARRRNYYLTESNRIQAFSSQSNGLDDFLRSCNMQMILYSANDYFDRCHELILRSNQFNISGKKYNKEEFENCINSGLAICWRINDLFGDYGIVGFLRIIEEQYNFTITDFVMSCRVAEKRVEESLFYWLKTYLLPTKPIYVNFIQTKRNSPIQKKIEDIGVKRIDSKGDSLLYNLDFALDLIDPLVMNINSKI